MKPFARDDIDSQSEVAADVQLQQAGFDLDEIERMLVALQLSRRDRLDPLPWLIGAGVLGGLALAALPPRLWARLGALLLGGSARLLRSPIGPVLLGAAWTHVLDASNRHLGTPDRSARPASER